MEASHARATCSMVLNGQAKIRKNDVKRIGSQTFVECWSKQQRIAQSSKATQYCTNTLISHMHFTCPWSWDAETKYLDFMSDASLRFAAKKLAFYLHQTHNAHTKYSYLISPCLGCFVAIRWASIICRMHSMANISTNNNNSNKIINFLVFSFIQC